MWAGETAPETTDHAHPEAGESFIREAMRFSDEQRRLLTEDTCRSCGRVGEGVICDQCEQDERDDYAREEADHG